MSNPVELTLPDWDLTIERARFGSNTEQKLLLTRDRLTAAIRYSRLRGDAWRIDQLKRRLAHVHELLDQV